MKIKFGYFLIGIVAIFFIAIAVDSKVRRKTISYYQHVNNETYISGKVTRILAGNGVLKVHLDTNKVYFSSTSKGFRGIKENLELGDTMMKSIGSDTIHIKNESKELFFIIENVSDE